MRIIGGAFRRRIVRFPPEPGLRPTPDRVRETLFNWLGQDLPGWRTLDLYAGTGVLSLEALSRGAALAVAVDRARGLVDALAATARGLGARGLEPHCADVGGFLVAEKRTFDVVFADPPYGEEPWPWLLPACAAHVAPGGYVYVEAAHAIAPAAPLSEWRSDKAGQVHYHLFKRDDGRAD